MQSDRGVGPAPDVPAVGAPLPPTAPETRRPYAAGWAAFEAWCRRSGAVALPADAEKVAAYLILRLYRLSRELATCSIPPQGIDPRLAAVYKRVFEVALEGPWNQPGIDPETVAVAQEADIVRQYQTMTNLLQAESHY